MNDQWGISNIATATLTVPHLPVPTCSNVRARAKQGGTKVTLTLKCTGPKGHPFSYGIVSKPSNGKLGKINQRTGKVTYTTHVGFSGSDRVVYNATNSGGSSKAATATVVFPKLGRITSTMTWPDFTAGATSSVVNGLTIKSLPGGAHVKLSCSKGCPIKTQTVALAKHRVCKGKGKKRKCKLVAPKTREPRPHALRRAQAGQGGRQDHRVDDPVGLDRQAVHVHDGQERPAHGEDPDPGPGQHQALSQLLGDPPDGAAALTAPRP